MNRDEEILEITAEIENLKQKLKALKHNNHLDFSKVREFETKHGLHPRFSHTGIMSNFRALAKSIHSLEIREYGSHKILNCKDLRKVKNLSVNEISKSNKLLEELLTVYLAFIENMEIKTIKMR